jgi:class 3 adenylate cyclase
MISINVFSSIDLLAVIISTHVLLAFCYRTARVSRRKIDLLFTCLVALFCLGAGLELAVDNVVPAGAAATAGPHAAALTLRLYQAMYLVGILVLPVISHFALRYTESRLLPGWKAAWLYAGALAISPLVFADGFLAARTAPQGATSSWACAVPWQPETGGWSAVLIVLWLAVNVQVQVMLWRHHRTARGRSLFDQRNFVWAGITMWGLAGLVSMLLGLSGYAGVDPGVFITACAMVVLAVGLAEDYHRSEAQRKHVTRRFESYVDPALVKYVIEHPQTTHIDGEVRELTVVFTDLEGFTTITERLREGAVTLLNEYLRLMVPLIRNHNGYRNKFLGDGMMFFYGAPEKNPDHAIHAVATVLKMQETMARFNELIAARRRHSGDDLPLLTMRTGVSSGQMIVGDAGPEEASDYTVLGDTVNLGARLESANKQLGTHILLSERTVQLLPPDLFLLRPIGRIQAVGLTRAVMTYEPLCHLSAATPAQLQSVELHRRLVERFAGSDFTGCMEIARRVESELGAHKLGALYRDLCAQHLRTPPGPAFTGQIILNEK